MRVIGLVVLVVVTASGCTQAPPPPTPVVTTAPSTVPSESASPPAPVPAGSPEWTFQAVSGGDVAATPTGYVLAGKNRETRKYEIVGLAKSGMQRWQKAIDGTDVSIHTVVAGSTVIRSRNNPARAEWPGSLIVEAFDAGTGAPVWSDDQPSFVTVLAGAVYTSVCHGGQNNRIGDCRLSARDPRTGAVRWTIKTYASASVTTADALPDPPAETMAAPQVPAYLVVVSYPTGHASQTWTTIDPKTGRELGLSVQATQVLQTGAALIAIDRADSKPSRGCETTLVARRPVGGGPIWRRTFTTLPQQGKDRCDELRHQASDRMLVVTDGSGRPAVVNVSTGQTEWTVGEPGAVVSIDQKVLVVQNAAGGLTVFDRGTRQVRWRTGALSSYGSAARLRVSGLDGWLAFSGYGESTICRGSPCAAVSVFDVVSGRLRQAPEGRMVSVSDGMIVTEVADASGTSNYRAYRIAG